MAEQQPPLVLIAESVETTRTALQRRLAGRGYRVTGAGDGEQALALIARAVPDVVLLDHALPGTGGMAVLDRLRADDELAAVPVIMLTESADPQLPVEALRRGAHDCMRRPFEPAELEARVMAAVRVKRLHDALVDANRRLAAQALTDDLTGLANRRSFTAEVEGAVADERPCALLMIDLDQFKELNDTLGHHVGDELLRGVGPRLSATMRPGDIVARLGGDEFGVLIKDADSETATVAASRLRVALGRPYALAGISLHVGASIGIAVFPEHAQDAGTLLRHSDVAMYEAKRGRTGHAVYASEGDHHSRDRLELAGEMRHALANDELTLHYQPVADLVTGKLLGVEALVRWRHPERGLLAPGAFLPAIEHTELMRELSRRVLAMAICQAGAWFRLEHPWRVSANLSATDLLDRSLVDDVSSLLRRYGTPARRLTLEVTESVLMTDPARAMQVLAELRGLGVQLALDDFGTGWSSLTHLQRMPVHEIKIDRSFVAAMATEANSAAIVSSTVDLAHALGLRVVAEGIEDEATWRRLRAVGCDAAQGYHLSRPLPAGEFETSATEIGERSRVAADVPLSAARPTTAAVHR
jgi:diguanylate cyclase (GGDEF)-like protein